MEDRLGLHIFVVFLAVEIIYLWIFISLEVYFLPWPPGLGLIKLKHINNDKVENW